MLHQTLKGTWKQHFSWDLGCFVSVVLPHACKLWNKSVHFFEWDMHFWKYPAYSFQMRVSFGACSDVGRRHIWILPHTSQSPSHQSINTMLWSAGWRCSHFKSREIPYKNRWLICQFAMCLPGRESGSTGGSPPAQLPEYNPFLLHVTVQSGLQRVKANVPFPQFFSTTGRDNPHYESLLVVKVPETSGAVFVTHNIIRRRT